TISGAGSLDIDQAGAMAVGSITVADGDVTISADSLAVGTIAAAGNVSLETSGGEISDTNAGQVNVTAETLTLSSAGGVELDTKVATLDAAITAAGDLVIRQHTEALTVAQLELFAGSVTLTSDAAITFQSLAINDHSLSVEATDVH